MKRYIVGFLILIPVIAQIAKAQNNADDLLKSRMRTPLLQAENTITGEGQCWHAAYDMNRFMDGFRSTQDKAYLNAAVKYYDALIAKMHTSPDGFKGWVGPYIYDKNYICDVHIGDAILINPMLDFSETVLAIKSNESFRNYQNKAQEYIKLAKTHLIKKWDERGTWHEDGLYGAYASWDQYMTADNMDEWQKLDVTKSTLTLPFNKQNSMAIACLRIYRMTGEEQYRERALKIFNYMKSRMCLYEDHYVWNYWEPFGEWDIDAAKSNTLRHWVNVHPYRNYQAGEVHEIAEAYHSGITFDQTDIERIINTNINVMWNGDTENPEWQNSNYAVRVAALGKDSIRTEPGNGYNTLAGTLWSGLFDFSKRARELSGKTFDKPVSLKRNHTELPVTVLDRPFNSTKNFVMAAAIPSQINQGDTANLVIQTRVAGDLKVELYTDGGEKRISTLCKEDTKNAHAGIHITKWDTATVIPGNYRIRWTLNDEDREFPVVVK